MDEQRPCATKTTRGTLAVVTPWFCREAWALARARRTGGGWARQDLAQMARVDKAVQQALDAGYAVEILTTTALPARAPWPGPVSLAPEALYPRGQSEAQWLADVPAECAPLGPGEGEAAQAADEAEAGAVKAAQTADGVGAGAVKAAQTAGKAEVGAESPEAGGPEAEFRGPEAGAPEAESLAPETGAPEVGVPEAESVSPEPSAPGAPSPQPGAPEVTGWVRDAFLEDVIPLCPGVLLRRFAAAAGDDELCARLKALAARRPLTPTQAASLELNELHSPRLYGYVHSRSWLQLCCVPQDIPLARYARAAFQRGADSLTQRQPL